MQEPVIPTNYITRKSNNAMLLAFAKGNAGAARVLSEKLLPKACAQAFNYLHKQTDVKDIAQDAFLDCGVLHQTGKKMCQLSTWLYFQSSNGFYVRLRRKTYTCFPKIR